jgi:hypothetical protein
MKAKFVLTLLMMAGIQWGVSHAEKISMETAEKVAKNYVRSVPKFDTRSAVQLTHKALKDGKRGQPLLRQGGDEEVYYYVFNVNNDQGFVIVSGDDVAVPVLGYSDNGKYDENNLPPNFVYWMDCLSQEIASATENKLQQSAETKAEWERYSKENVSLRAGSVIVGPLVQTKWNQGAPYNALCPEYQGIKAVTGCVATAMAQIMKYHEWPQSPSPSDSIHSYKTSTKDIGIPKIEAGSATYEWSNMSNTYGSNSDINNAVATLMYHCGVSVEMDYIDVNGESGASTPAVAIALVKYFDYDAGVTSLGRDYYSYSEWEAKIKTELEASRPVLYYGRSSTGGHAFVCDGYDNNNFFHFNWGWGGSSDGYFELSALNPSSIGIGGGTGGYNMQQGMIVGIQANQNNSPNIILGLSDLISSKTSLSSLTEPFSVSAKELTNIGSSTINNVYLGVWLCEQNDTPIEYKKTNVTLGLPSGYHFTNNYSLYSNYTLPSNLTFGIYKLYGVFSTTDEPDSPIKILGGNGIKYILVTVNSNNTVTLATTESTAPALSLGSLAPVGTLYQNRIGKFTASITNNGSGDYYSKLSIKLDDSTIETQPVVIPASTTKEIGFSGTVSLSPDNHSITLWFDPNNSSPNSTSPAPSEQLGNATMVTIQNTPSEPNISVESFSFLNGNSSVPANAPNLTVKLKNIGGLFDGAVNIIITNVGTGQLPSIGSFGTKNVTIESGKEIDVLFNNPIALSPGSYYAFVRVGGTQIGYQQFTLVSPINPSDDATLSNLTVNAGILTPPFDAQTLSYTVDVGNDVTNVRIIGTANHANASVFENGTKSLNVGPNIFTIRVRAEDGSTENSYQVTVNRSLPPLTLTLARGRNWYLSSPVSNAIANTAFAGATYVEYYDETRSTPYTIGGASLYDGWVNITSASTTLTPGKGYVVWADEENGTSDITYTFTGAQNSSSVSVPLTRTTGVEKEGFNLVGNPYTSHIDWDAVIYVNSTVEPTIWYRTKESNDYHFYTYNSTSNVSEPSGLDLQYIPPMQGFWVRATEAGTLTFTPDAKVNNTNNNVLRALPPDTRPLIRLQLADDAKTDRIVIFADENAQNGFDRYDSEKMFDTGAAIYTKAGGEKLIFNGLGAITEGLEIPLGFVTDHSGTYTLSATETVHLGNLQPVLKDNILNTEFNLSDGEAYHFTSDATDNTSRFSVIFRSGDDVGNTQNPGNDEILVYARNHTLYVESPVPVKQVQVYDLPGRLLYSAKEHIIYNVRPGIHIVRVETENGTVNRKVTVK